MRTIHVAGGVAFRSGRAFVTLHWGDETGQMDAAEARQFALNILTVAESAEQDAATCKALRLAGEEMAGFLSLLREARGSDPAKGSASTTVHPEDLPDGSVLE